MLWHPVVGVGQPGGSIPHLLFRPIQMTLVHLKLYKLLPCADLIGTRKKSGRRRRVLRSKTTEKSEGGYGDFLNFMTGDVSWL